MSLHGDEHCVGCGVKLTTENVLPVDASGDVPEWKRATTEPVIVLACVECVVNNRLPEE